MCAFGNFSRFLSRRPMRWLIARSTALIADVDDGELGVEGAGAAAFAALAAFDADAFDALDG